MAKASEKVVGAACPCPCRCVSSAEPVREQAAACLSVRRQPQTWSEATGHAGDAALSLCEAVLPRGHAVPCWPHAGPSFCVILPGAS